MQAKEDNVWAEERLKEMKPTPTSKQKIETSVIYE
jgi:hypothetical protein